MKKLFLLIAFVQAGAVGFAQNVGIGTSNPMEKLSVVTGTGYGISHEAASIKLSTFIDGSSAYFGTVTDHPFHLYTNNGSAQLTLLQNGNIGMGNFNPEYKLDIVGRMRIRTGAVGNIFTTSGIWMDDYRDGSPRIFLGMQDSIRLGIWGEGNPGAGWALNFNARNGNLGIGVSAPTQKLEVNGNVLSTGNITANSYQYTTAKTYYYSIPPSSFIPTRISLNETYVSEWYFEDNGENTVYSNDPFGVPFVAAVHLPDGATVTSLKVYGFDNFVVNDIDITLRRRLHESAVYETMCLLQSSDYPGDFEISSSSINFPLVSNMSYNYTIYVDRLCQNLKIKSVRITYTMPGAP